MNEINRQIELAALIAEIEAMKAENAYREYTGMAVMYGEEAFLGVAERMRALKDEPTEGKTPEMYSNEIDLETNTLDLGLSVRAGNALSRNGKKRLSDIIAMTPTQLRRMNHVGEKIAEEVEYVVNKCGYKMKGAREL